MARQTRPAHHVLTPLEMAAWDDAKHERDRADGFLLALLLALSPALAPLAIYALFWWGWL